MKPLPGLGGSEDWRIEGPRYQQIAYQTQQAVFRLLHLILAKEATVPGHGDGGPIISGCIGAALCFAMESGQPPEAVRAQVVKVLDEVLPQIAMARASAGAEAGHA